MTMKDDRDQRGTSEEIGAARSDAQDAPYEFSESDDRRRFLEGLKDELPKVTDADPPKLDFYKDLNMEMPSASVFSARGVNRIRQSARKKMWIASSSICAGVALILVLTTVTFAPDASDRSAFSRGVADSVDMKGSAGQAKEDEAGASAVAGDAEGTEGSNSADLPVSSYNYDGIFAALEDMDFSARDENEAPVEATDDSTSGAVGLGSETATPDSLDAGNAGSAFGRSSSAESSASESFIVDETPVELGTSGESGTFIETETPDVSETPDISGVPVETEPPDTSGTLTPTDGGDKSARSSSSEAARAEDEAYSDTNVQTEGVQEADVLKTDGRYIYTANSKNICVLEANGGRPRVLSKIPQVLDRGQVYFEMYLTYDKLVLVRQGYNNLAARGDASGEKSIDGIDYAGNAPMIDTSIDIYDVSDRESPKKVRSLSQSGAYTDSRMIGDKLYLVSLYENFDSAAFNKKEPRTFVPLYAEGAKQLMSRPTDITIPKVKTSMMYTVISGVDTGKARFVSHKSLFGERYDLYASTDSLYLFAPKDYSDSGKKDDYEYEKYSDGTKITRLSLNGGNVKVEASAEIPGRVNDVFSIDEYRNILRVVTTKSEYQIVRSASGVQWSEERTDEKTTGLYTLDLGMKTLGKVENLPSGEDVYSCRFAGDVAYFVTFLKKDPLFSVDVSDPEAPKVVGELKIPGFSDYMHAYAPGLLFGLGNDADETTGAVRGLKVSMFDNSNPHDVIEKDKFLLNDLNDSYVSENHKAILVSARRSLIAFPADEKYVIIKYDAGSGFVRVLDISPDVPADVWSGGLRGIFIGDVFYVIAPDSIYTYDMTDEFKRIDSLTLDEGARAVSPYSYSDFSISLR
jgi:uncharacterized secreted protein with C-terminal beta-propeller domain